MNKFVFSLIFPVILLVSCEEDGEHALHPLEGNYSGELAIYNGDGTMRTSEDILLAVDRQEGDTLSLNFVDNDLNGSEIVEYTAIISNNSSMILPSQMVDGELHTGQGSVNTSNELKIIIKRLQDGSNVIAYTGVKQ
jgi:hypothetical protein